MGICKVYQAKQRINKSVLAKTLNVSKNIGLVRFYTILYNIKMIHFNICFNKISVFLNCKFT